MTTADEHVPLTLDDIAYASRTGILNGLLLDRAINGEAS